MESTRIHTELQWSLAFLSFMSFTRFADAACTYVPLYYYGCELYPRETRQHMLNDVDSCKQTCDSTTSGGSGWLYGGPTSRCFWATYSTQFQSDGFTCFLRLGWTTEGPPICRDWAYDDASPDLRYLCEYSAEATSTPQQLQGECKAYSSVRVSRKVIHPDTLEECRRACEKGKLRASSTQSLACWAFRFTVLSSLGLSQCELHFAATDPNIFCDKSAAASGPSPTGSGSVIYFRQCPENNPPGLMFSETGITETCSYIQTDYNTCNFYKRSSELRTANSQDDCRRACDAADNSGASWRCWWYSFVATDVNLGTYYNICYLHSGWGRPDCTLQSSATGASKEFRRECRQSETPAVLSQYKLVLQPDSTSCTVSAEYVSEVYHTKENSGECQTLCNSKFFKLPSGQHLPCVGVEHVGRFDQDLPQCTLWFSASLMRCGLPPPVSSDPTADRYPWRCQPDITTTVTVTTEDTTTETLTSTAEAPTTAVEAPTTTVEAPTTAVEAPTTTVEAPTTTVEAPTTTVEAPTSTVEAPTTTVEAPTTTMEAPTTTVEAPATTVEAPTTTVEAPTTTAETPTTTVETPTTTSATTETPTTSVEAPTTTSKTPNTTTGTPTSTVDTPRSTVETRTTSSQTPTSTAELTSTVAPTTNAETTTTTASGPTTVSDTSTFTDNISTMAVDIKTTTGSITPITSSDTTISTATTTAVDRPITTEDAADSPLKTTSATDTLNTSATVDMSTSASKTVAINAGTTSAVDKYHSPLHTPSSPTESFTTSAKLPVDKPTTPRDEVSTFHDTFPTTAVIYKNTSIASGFTATPTTTRRPGHSSVRKCFCLMQSRATPTTLPPALDVIAPDLSLDVSKLSSKRRRKESSSDPRAFPLQMGSVWMTLLLMVFGLVLLSDLPHLYHDLVHGHFTVL